jgi:hypothetical protein
MAGLTFDGLSDIRPVVRAFRPRCELLCMACLAICRLLVLWFVRSDFGDRISPIMTVLIKRRRGEEDHRCICRYAEPHHNQDESNNMSRHDFPILGPPPIRSSIEFSMRPPRTTAVTEITIVDGDPLKIDACQNSTLIAKKPRHFGGALLQRNNASEAAIPRSSADGNIGARSLDHHLGWRGEPQLIHRDDPHDDEAQGHQRAS